MLVLTEHRKVMAGFGVLGTSTFEQVIGRLEEPACWMEGRPRRDAS
jgi:hypothetical protein